MTAPGCRYNGEPPFCAAELDAVRTLLAEGHSYRQVARRLDRDPRAVARHAQRMGLRSAHPPFHPAAPRAAA